MTSFLFKIVFNPVGLWLSAVLFDGLMYGSWVQAVLLGLVIAIVETLLEVLLLKRGTLWISTLVDWAAVTLLVYFITPLFDKAAVNFIGALLTGLLFTFIEYFLHRFLLSAGLTRKREHT